jgi:Holliday junction resolvase
MREIVNEAGVKREVKRLLKKYGWYYWMPPANAFGRAGIADFNAVHNGRFLAIETKFGSNRPTPLQQQFLDSIAAHGGLAIVITERNLGELEDLLSSVEKEK